MSQFSLDIFMSFVVLVALGLAGLVIIEFVVNTIVRTIRKLKYKKEE